MEAIAFCGSTNRSIQPHHTAARQFFRDRTCHYCLEIFGSNPERCPHCAAYRVWLVQRARGALRQA
jgi:hypothetical protein